MTITRRALLTAAAAGAAAIAAPFAMQRRGDGHLTARIRPPTQPIAPGEHALGLGADRDGLLIVPKGYRATMAAPLLLLLHGAGGSGRRVSSLFAPALDLGFIVLAPDSRDRTWDAIRGNFGPDVDFLNRALNHTFDRCAIDRRHVAIGGFSDGATYALSVGVASGDLFTHIVACSPGFIVASTMRGRPWIYVSHGKNDQILPIDSTSRRLVPELQNAGYPLKYHEFEGPHAVPPAIAAEAMKWVLG
jgi:phospholipase/carboxylesterase